jgi:hypothetical protein
MGNGLVRVVACLVGITVGTGAAHADPPDREANLRRARQHFYEGKKAFEEKRYPAALEEFQAGYDLEPRPGFLLDMAHCARKMGDLPRARELYERFLETDPPEADRHVARQFVAEIDRKLEQNEAPRDPWPAPAKAEAARVAGEPPEPPVAALPRVVVTPESLSAEPVMLSPVPEARDPSRQDQASSGKWWLWAGLGGVVLGAAAVLIVRALASGDDAQASGSWGQVKL